MRMGMRILRWGSSRTSKRGGAFSGGFARGAFTTSELLQLLISPVGLLGRQTNLPILRKTKQNQPNINPKQDIGTEGAIGAKQDIGTEGEMDHKGGPRGEEAPPRGRSFFGRLFTVEAAGWVGAIFAASALWEVLRANHGLVGEKIKHLFFTTLEVRSSRAEFAWIVDWMSRQPEGRHARNLTLRPISVVDERYRGGEEGVEENSDEGGRAVLVPGYGSHFFTFRATPMWISRRPDPVKSRKPTSHVLDREDDVLVLTMLTRRREVLEDFLTAVRSSWRAYVRRWVQIYVADHYGGWVLLTERSLRPLSTLFLPETIHAVVEEVRAFLTLRELYAGLGIPWRRGYLFEGPPGTGKSSFAMALAGELRLPIYLLSLRGRGLSDDGLLHRIGLLPPRCILLIEDFENAIRTEGKGASAELANTGNAAISLSGFLNTIDGVASGEGRILIMTTNDAAKIPAPEAVLRPGRVDRRVVFPRIHPSEMEKMRGSFEEAVHRLPMGKEGEVEDQKDSKSDLVCEESLQSNLNSPGGAATPAEFQQELLNRVYATLLQKIQSDKKNLMSFANSQEVELNDQ
ncbi:unnamed protein product [Phytomonas sp. Hart1]|nr:unnamed protein product [Phytomonas sp. Hart1]|eukprot:CCW69282.1 unnamed protein product [Phytomonas sp. isolate Hart1]